MYDRVTPLGVALSTIQCEEREILGRTVYEFYFTALSPQGGEWEFRQQADARGIKAWRLYRRGQAGDESADVAIARSAYGALPPGHTDGDIDELIRRAEGALDIDVFLLTPGHIDAIDRPDFVFLPFTRATIGVLRSFASASAWFFRRGIMSSMRRKIDGARTFHLNGKMKNQFFNDPLSELGQVKESFDKRGFYLAEACPEDHFRFLPAPVTAMISDGSAPLADLRLERGGQWHMSGAAIVGQDGLPVGWLREIQPFFNTYASIVGQAMKIRKLEEEEAREMEKEQARRSSSRIRPQEYMRHRDERWG